MKKFIFLIILLFLLVIAFNTNPTEQEYEHWLKDQVMSQVNNKVEKGAIAAFGDAVIQRNTTSQDYLFFTIFHTTYQGKDIKVIGAYNHFVPFELSK